MWRNFGLSSKIRTPPLPCLFNMDILERYIGSLKVSSMSAVGFQFGGEEGKERPT